MAKAGTGSGRAAEGRESGDSSAVKSASRGVGMDGPGSTAGLPSAQGGGADGDGMEGGVPGSTPAGAEEGSEAGAGKNQGTGGGAESPSAEAGKVAKIPDDIPVDGSAEDQVAKQIRAAAEAETDPKIRDALWNEYRKQMGMKTK
jgi:hypothetical protein